MSSTDLAVFCGSSRSSQPLGLPVSTAQKRQARVQTEPISMMVAVPLDQHSPMFGQCDSWHTVLRRCSPTLRLTASKRLPLGALTRSQLGLGSTTCGSVEARRFWPSLIAVIPWGVRNFSPLETGLGGMVSDIGLSAPVGAALAGLVAGAQSTMRRWSAAPGRTAGADHGLRGWTSLFPAALASPGRLVRLLCPAGKLLQSFMGPGYCCWRPGRLSSTPRGPPSECLYTWSRRR